MRHTRLLPTKRGRPVSRLFRAKVLATIHVFSRWSNYDARRAADKVMLSKKGSTDLVGELDATGREAHAIALLGQQAGADQSRALVREWLRGRCPLEQAHPDH